MNHPSIFLSFYTYLYVFRGKESYILFLFKEGFISTTLQDEKRKDLAGWGLLGREKKGKFFFSIGGAGGDGDGNRRV
jgi:hypothetical protein